MQKTRTLSQKIGLFIKGLLMGAANKVPGVSGGMVAFVTGFYEEMIYSFQKINGTAFKFLFRGRFKSFYRYTNGGFLLFVFLGSTFSYFSVSRVLDYFLKKSETSELYVWSLFFGMILGSIYYISQKFKSNYRTNIMYIIAGISVGILLSFMDPATENKNLFFVFFCGIVGVSGMTLPGLSGSFILILLGNYVLLLVDSVNVLSTTIGEVVYGNFSFLQDAVQTEYLIIILVFTAGSAFGLVSTSHALGFLLKKYHDKITAIIIGFITGSLGIVWPWKKEIFKTTNEGVLVFNANGDPIMTNYERFFPNLTSSTTILAIGFILIGMAIVILIDLYEKKKQASFTNYGLIGKVLGYSFSERYFTKKFKKENIKKAVYKNYELDRIDDVLSLKKQLNLKGFNVTIPYKEAILPYLDVILGEAKEIGAVNTVKVTEDNKWVGYNTDVYGFETSFKEQLLASDTKALLLGTGGASKAVIYVLKSLGISYLEVSRNPIKENQISYSSLNESLISSHTIIINATPVGTFPKVKDCPDIPYEYLTDAHYLYDLIYNPNETLFLKKGKEKGARIKNGKTMLVFQAEKAWSIWD